MFARRVVARYVLAAKVKDYMQLVRRAKPQIERKLLESDAEGAVKLFRELGEQLHPLATMLDGVRFERKDEQQKMKNVVHWLHRLKYPFEGKFLDNGPGEVEAWISIQLPSIEETLKSLLRVQGRLDSYDTVEKSFRHGPFKVINRFGYRPDEYEGALQVFDKAAEKLKAKGFGNVLYGEVHLVGGSEGKGRKTWAGKYRETGDVVWLNAEAAHRFDSVFTLVHEFGHRHWYKKLSQAQRDAYEDHYSKGLGIDLAARQDMWQALVKADFSPRKAIQFLRDPSLTQSLADWFKDRGYQPKDLLRAYQQGEAWVEKNFVLPNRRYVFPADSVNTVTVSQYAKSNVLEDYAETFAHYVLGMPVPPEVMARFEPTL